MDEDGAWASVSDADGIIADLLPAHHLLTQAQSSPSSAAPVQGRLSVTSKEVAGPGLITSGSSYRTTQLPHPHPQLSQETTIQGTEHPRASGRRAGSTAERWALLSSIPCSVCFPALSPLLEGRCCSAWALQRDWEVKAPHTLGPDDEYNHRTPAWAGLVLTGVVTSAVVSLPCRRSTGKPCSCCGVT